MQLPRFSQGLALNLHGFLFSSDQDFGKEGQGLARLYHEPSPTPPPGLPAILLVPLRWSGAKDQTPTLKVVMVFNN